MEGFVLKILSGQQAGAEVLLSPGEYSLGSAEEDDLQFNDLSLLPGHARLRVAANAVEIRAEAGGVASGNGLELEIGDDHWRELEPLDIISIGMVRFAVGAATANWASIADAMKLKTGEETEHPADKVERPADWTARLRDLPASAFFAGLGVLLILALAGWVLAGSGGEVAKRILAKPDPQADFSTVQQAIAGISFPHSIEVRQEVDGAIFVSGYVRTLAERRAVVMALDETGAEVGLRIWVTDVLRSGVASLLESSGYEVEFEITEAGVLILRGVVLDSAVAARLLHLVDEQVLGLSSVRPEIRTAEDLLLEIRELAGRARIDDTVLLRLDGTLVEASGMIGADKIDLWAGFVESYMRNFAELIPMRSYVQLARSDGSVSPQIAAPKDESGRAYGIEASDGSRLYGHDDHLDLHLNQARPVAEAMPDPGDAGGAVRMALDSGWMGGNGAALLPPQSPARPGPPFRAPPVDQRAAPRSGIVQTGPELAQLLNDTRALAGRGVPGSAGPHRWAGDGSRRAGPLRPGVEILPEQQGVMLMFQMPQAIAEQKELDIARVVAEPYPPISLFLISPSVNLEKLRQRQEAENIAKAQERLLADGPEVKLREVDSPEPAAAPQPALANLRPGTEFAAYEPARLAPGRPVPVRPALGDARIADFLAEVVPASARPACGQRRFGRADLSPASNPNSAEALELPMLTHRLLLAWRDGRLKGKSMPDGMDELASALELIARVRKESVALRSGGLVEVADPFAALDGCPPLLNQCWPGSKLDRGNLPAVMLWLDMLSISETTSLAMFQPHNQALILEAGLNPKRVAQCATGTVGPADVSLSIYIADSTENPGIVNAVAGRLDRFSISISGANLIGQRYVQTADGEKLREGAAPTADSRLLHIGELGSYFRTARGLAVAIYDTRMTWFFDG